MSEGFVAFCQDEQCRPLESGGGVAGGGPIVISAPVGNGGTNRQDDVRTIQRALNDVPDADGGPLPPLAVDGASGPKTIGAIHRFQLHHFGWSSADGRVDPDKRTLARLNELLGGVTETGQVARVQGLLGRALACIRAAQRNLELAEIVAGGRASGTSLLGSREERMRLVNRHFRVDDHPPAMRRGIVQHLLTNYNRMMSVFARPGGLWGIHSFADDPLYLGHVAYAYRGGYFRPGTSQVEKGTRIRLDAIYLGKRFEEKTDEVCVNVIVHELAHFVGHPYHIADHGYGWHDDPRIQRLNPQQRLLNASNYNNFAFDVKHRRKPIGMK